MEKSQGVGRYAGLGEIVIKGYGLKYKIIYSNNMGLIVPTHEDYYESANNIASFFGDQKELEFAIYGSFTNLPKLRPGLSDIDIFLIHHTHDILFPIEISELFSGTKSGIEKLGIPLQINWTTQGQQQSRFLSSDSGYLQEVKTGMKSPYYSDGILNAVEKINRRVDSTIDDENMARYFQRKTGELGVILTEVGEILKQDGNHITREDQRKIWKLWDLIKKIISYIGASLRARTGQSYFSKNDKELIQLFSENFQVSKEAPVEDFLRVLESIRNIGDWYNFLRDKNGIQKIRELYTKVFNPLLLAAAKEI